VLYRQQGLEALAEQWLRQALALRGDSEVPLRALHDLLQAQGRDAEARVYAQRVQRLQESDPYYWIAEGMQHLSAGQASRAAAALERAEFLTSGFGEVHRYLAVAYWNLGERERARKHLAQLAALDLGGHVTAKLRRKFGPETH
jgi:predicted Zn-dependent protease